MKSTSDINNFLNASDFHLLNLVMDYLQKMKSKGLICGAYVGMDLANRMEFNVIHIKFLDAPETYFHWIRIKLIELGYVCSKMHESAGAKSDLFMIPTGLYFHVNFKLTKWESIKYFICKYIFKLKIF